MGLSIAAVVAAVAFDSEHGGEHESGNLSVFARRVQDALWTSPSRFQFIRLQMSTFSPSPVPRRTVRRQTTSHGHSPPIARRTRAGGSKPPSRFATPARHQERLPSVRDDESHTSGMDVDEGFEIHERISKAETIFAKSEESTATFYAQLPVEVKQALRNAGMPGSDICATSALH